MIKKSLITLTSLIGLTVTASAEVSSADIAFAIEQKYGAPAQNESLSVSVNKVSPYSGKTVNKEEGLPEKFITVVWEKTSNRFAVLVEDDNKEPVRILGNVIIDTKYPTLNSNLAIGDIIDKSDISYAVFKGNRNNIATSEQDIVGKEVTRFIAQDKPIPLDAITAPRIIKRNQEVQVVFRQGGLELSSSGKALSNAAAGETVKVSRKDASRIIEGVATDDGLVIVTGE